MQITVEVDNKTVARKLAKLKTSLLSWDEAMFGIGLAFRQYMATKPFASRGSVFGETWPALSPAYEQWKAKAYPGRPILVRAGDLSRGFEFTSNSDTMRLQNVVSYFAKHQEGDGVPQRVSMGVNDELKQTAASIIGKELQRKLNGL